MGHQTAQWAILGRPKSCGWADWPSWANWAITGPTPMDALSGWNAGRRSMFGLTPSYRALSVA